MMQDQVYELSALLVAQLSEASFRKLPSPTWRTVLQLRRALEICGVRLQPHDLNDVARRLER